MQRPADHPTIATGKVGVLVVNLGTPDAPDTASVKRYLKEFLSDKRVVEIPTLIWQPILRGIILNTRPQKSAQAYAKVWTDKGSPLAFFTAGQADVLQARMGESADVRYAMRYGNPSVADQLAAMKAAGCNRILMSFVRCCVKAATNDHTTQATDRSLVENIFLEIDFSHAFAITDDFHLFAQLLAQFFRAVNGIDANIFLSVIGRHHGHTAESKHALNRGSR
jgi:protoheme ferro-lyase